MKRLLLSLIITLSTQVKAQTPGAGVTIDGYTYQTVIISNREWMAENLKATHFESGLSFFQASNVNQFATLPVTMSLMNGPYATPVYTNPSWGSDNGNGKLYNYSVVYRPDQIIKTGWHVPTKAEWQQMISYTNADAIDNIRKVESGSENYWTCTGNFIDQYGFSAIGVGRVKVNDATSAEMDFMGSGAFYWCVAGISDAEDGQDNVSYVNINCNGIGAGQYMNANFTINRRSAVSVRLIKDAPLSTNDFNKSKVLVYPNPAQNELNIETDEVIVSVEVYDLLGKQILNGTDKKIDVSYLERGIYLLKIITNRGSAVQKFMKD